MGGVAAYQDVSDDEPRWVEEYAPLVKRIAHHLLGRLPANILADDLIQAGMIGLLEASRNFDESKGASFSTYAGIRIRGAMLDEVRRGDWAPRSVHRNYRLITQAIRDIENKLGRDAKDCEVAKSLDMNLEEYHSILNDANGTRIFSFEDLGVNEGVFSQNIFTQSTGPLDKLQKEKLKKQLAEEIKKLPKRERLVMALYYDEELNLKEVGEVLGVSESRISQIHSQAMVRLEARMEIWKV